MCRWLAKLASKHMIALSNLPQYPLILPEFLMRSFPPVLIDCVHVLLVFKGHSSRKTDTRTSHFRKFDKLHWCVPITNTRLQMRSSSPWTGWNTATWSDFICSLYISPVIDTIYDEVKLFFASCGMGCVPWICFSCHFCRSLSRFQRAACSILLWFQRIHARYANIYLTKQSNLVLRGSVTKVVDGLGVVWAL